jgi:hypothetical protein
VIRPSASSLFVVFAIGVATTVGVASQKTSGAATDSSLPSDVETYGFVQKGATNGVVLLDATRPFTIALGNGPVHGVPPRGDRLGAARALVTRELARYPKTLLEQIKLRGVVFIDELAEGENAIPSLPNVGGLLLLDVGSKEADLVRTFHHEVFHFFDLADDGRLTPDPEWSALNQASFAYGAGGRTLRQGWAAKPTTELAGFVSGYATSAVEEDKAETFALAVSRTEAIRAQAADDRVVAAKLAVIVQRVGSMDSAAPRTLGLE